jgi:hypothetical protein
MSGTWEVRWEKPERPRAPVLAPEALRGACRNGHPFVEGSYTWQRAGNGWPFRQCRQCNAERAKLWRAAARQKIEQAKEARP